MHLTDELEQARRDRLIESIIAMVKAPDGDSEAIGNLANACRDQYSLQKVVDFLSSTEKGKQVFQKQPRLGKVDLQKLSCLPDHTLGYIYANHCLKNNLTPLVIPNVDDDYQFLSAHITETHDIWHVVTGCNTDILGEIKIEAFYVAQLYSSRLWVALLVKNLMKAAVYDVEVSTQYLEAIYSGWLMAKQAEPLFGVEWNQLWDCPLEDIRASLNIKV